MRILYVTGNWIGDAILSTGPLATLIERHPEARITVACGPTAAPLFSAVPNLERVIPMPKRRRHGHWVRLWWACIGHYWDIVVDCRGSVIAYVLLAGRRYPRLQRYRYGHVVEQYARILRLDHVPAPRLWAAPAHRAAAETLVPPGPPVLALAPIANWPGKEWPPDRFAELALRLTAPDGILPGGRIAIFGGGGGRERIAPLFERIPEARRIDLMGKADLLTAFACLSCCALFVGNDSGTMHLAAVSGVPTLGLFGPSRAELFRPWGERCAAVRTVESFEEIVHAPDYDYRSPKSVMTSLTVDTVEAAARTLLRP